MNLFVHEPQSSRLQRVIVCMTLSLLLFMGGCRSVPVAEQVSQERANEIVATLHGHGIGAVANREVGSGSQFEVAVGRKHYAEANAILHAKKLLQPERPGFVEIVSPRGILPNSRELEALRADYARAARIEELLEEIPNILSARAMVRISSALEKGEPQRVAVVLRVRSADAFEREQAEALLAKSFPIDRENIVLSVHQASTDVPNQVLHGVYNKDGKVVAVPLTTFLRLWRVPEDEYLGLSFGLVGCMVLMGLLGGVIGYSVGTYQRGKKSRAASLVTRRASERPARSGPPQGEE